jgi:hypothetical protein
VPQLTLIRAAFFLVLLANLAFLTWASLIDRPAASPPASATARLPRLQLASEVRPQSVPVPDKSPPTNVSTGAGPNGDPGAAPSGATGATPNAGAPAAGAAGGAGSGAAGASAAAPVTATPEVAAASGNAPLGAHCVSVGPFADPSRSAQGATLLRARGFSPRQRAEAGEPWSGYWVYVGELTGEAQQTEVMRRLERSGISDAQVMPSSEEGRRVSVGLFTERQGAERRAKAVRDLGLKAEIAERKQTPPAYWVDLDFSSSTQTLPMEGLLSLEDTGVRLEIRECPKESPGSPVAPAGGAARTGQAARTQ